MVPPVLEPRLLSERLCVWCFPAILVLFTIGFLAADLLPPPKASASAAEIARFYLTDVDLKRFGVMCMATGGLLILPFGIALASEVRRIEGPGSPMASLAVGAATFTATATIIYMFVLLALMFRTDRDPELIRLANDIAWVPFVGMWQPGALQAAAVGVAVLGDSRSGDERVFPRWTGWLMVWYALASMVGNLVPFFLDGPFSWHGIYPFYVGAIALFGWWSVAAFFLFRDLRRRRA